MEVIDVKINSKKTVEIYEVDEGGFIAIWGGGDCTEVYADLNTLVAEITKVFGE